MGSPGSGSASDLTVQVKLLHFTIFGVCVAGAINPPDGSVFAAPPFDIEVILGAADAVGGQRFGTSVDIDGDWAVIGAHLDSEAGPHVGAAYIFRRNAGGSNQWTQIKKLAASDISGHAEFGNSVAISEDTVIVGAIFDDVVPENSGSALIFQRDQGGADNWGEVAKLVPVDAAPHDGFGSSVDIDQDTIVVGAAYDDPGGSAYVYERNHGGTNAWGMAKKLTDPGNAGNFVYGFSVSIDGDTIAIGAPQTLNFGISGAAHIYGRNHGGAKQWGRIRRIVPSDAAQGDAFGTSVSIAADTVVIGARGDDDVGIDSGSAYIFGRNHGGSNLWGRITKITAADAVGEERFGSATAIDGSTVLVGAGRDTHAGELSGAAYLFERDNAGPDQWGQVIKLTASNPAAGDRYGVSVAIRQQTVVVGAFWTDHPCCQSGSVYVYNASICGDALVEGAEVCDDGYSDECGTCNADCTAPGAPSVCGDGELCPETENCDDGFMDTCGICNADCTGPGVASTCGDGEVCPESEACDDGFTDDCGTCNAECTGTGTASNCGDGELCAESEECDDGNNLNGDGCSSACLNESLDSTPTVSVWGLVVLALLFLVGTKIKFGSRRPDPA